jgi:hypothetical protein
LQIKTKIVLGDSKPVKQEVNHTVILPPFSIPCVNSLLECGLLWGLVATFGHMTIVQTNDILRTLMRTKSLRTIIAAPFIIQATGYIESLLQLILLQL